MYSPKLPLLLLVLLGAASRLPAVSYVVPADRFEIERAGAVITGRVLGSRVQETPGFGIETVTDVSVEETIKGSVERVVGLHEPGGVLGDEGRLMAGVPGFAAGERVLLLLYRRDNGDFTVSDLQLGAFHFARDISGQELAVRDESELSGWDVGGAVHREQHRAAEPFLAYVRAIVRGERTSETYVVPTLPLAESTALAKTGVLHPAGDAAFTVTSYTMSHSGGLGVRWNVFPGNVNWNQGNFESGALGNGTAQINVGFGSWDGAGAHYVLATSNANPNGFLEPADGVNNIVFEKNLTSFGVQPFSCTSGGVLGLGGTHAVFGAGTHQFNGETFGTITEGDVSLNQGISNCTTNQLPPGEFNSLLTHELGHTLDLRHSDQNRTLNAACSSDPTLDCSNQAIMNHILVSGLNGKLQAWDLTAFGRVYSSAAPVCTPPSIAQQPLGSTIVSGNSAQLSVAAAGTAPFTYQWFIGASGDASTPVGGGTGAAIFVSPAVTTSYWVRVTGQCAPTVNSAAAMVIVSAATCPAVTLGAPQVAALNDGFQLSISASGGAVFTNRWFEGPTSGAGTQIGVGNPLFVHPSRTTSYWCRVSNQCGNSADSGVITATVTVPPGRRHIALH